jgi:hypothetical protein
VCVLDATTATADLANFCPTDGVCYNIGVPPSSVASGSGNLYFQIRYPTSYQWVALGTGGSMSGANIFVTYQDGSGNVTLSPRRGTGHIMPRVDTSATGAKLTLLEGSGVSDGTVVANVLCTNCNSWSGGGSMSLSSTSANWIGAWRQGSALNSASVSANLIQHDGQVAFQLDLSQATISADSNPFISGSGNNGGDGSGNGNGDDGNSGGSGGGSTGGSGGVVIIGGSPNKMLLAHGIVMAVVFVVMYPVGALLMPLLGKWAVHAGWQFVAFLAMWAGLALGVIVAQDFGLVSSSTPPLLLTQYVELLSSWLCSDWQGQY